MTPNTLASVYGPDPDLQRDRQRLIQSALDAFHSEFPEQRARVFRCPGRINLRGMHVDTHGGYLNLMTHHREIVLVAAPYSTNGIQLHNTDPVYPAIECSIDDLASHPAFREDWYSFITHPDITARVGAQPGSWLNYVLGCALRVKHRWPDVPLVGISGVVAGDIPRGASLSSSAALCITTLLALLAFNEHDVDETTLIRLAREAEWFTGARIGMSDQAAMILGRRNDLVHAAFDPETMRPTTLHRMHFPEGLQVIVADSLTQRSLSGAARARYNLNRFSYSLALDVLRQELAKKTGTSIESLPKSLSGFTGPFFTEAGGDRYVYEVLLRIPEHLTLADLKCRYSFPDLDNAYRHYLGGIDPVDVPDRVPLRGPLLYGLAESERARRFAEQLECGEWERAGRLMSIGHDGDRLEPPAPASDEVLRTYAEARKPLAEVAGQYGASSPALDMLVDVALGAGALGASLTGAGIAGSILALSRREHTSRITAALGACLSSPAYRSLTGQTITGDRARSAVQVNTATHCASEIQQGH